MNKQYFEEDILDSAITTHQNERKEKRSPLHEKKAKNAEKARLAAAARKSRRKVYMIAVVILVVLIALFGRNAYQIIRLTKEKKAQEEKLLQLQEDIDYLRDELTRVTSDEYIEQQAREQLRMIYPGEVLYVVTE